MDRLRRRRFLRGENHRGGGERAGGWGEPVYDKLDAENRLCMMGINAVKGVRSAPASPAVEQKAPSTRRNDAEGYLSNNAGGILGGISSGQDIVVNIAVKPTSSIRLPRVRSDSRGRRRGRNHRAP